MIRSLEKIKSLVNLIEYSTHKEDYTKTLCCYEEFIEKAIRYLRKYLIKNHNLFISNPLYIINHSYTLSIISHKEVWIEALELYNKFKYLVPLEDVNHELLKKISPICDLLSEEDLLKDFESESYRKSHVG